MKDTGHGTSRDRRKTAENDGDARNVQQLIFENLLQCMLRRTHTSSSSKFSSSPGLVERPPMLDISNKLHALVDEFVSNMSSEVDSLANTISAVAHKYVVNDSALTQTQTQSRSNRTTSEVLKGLKRPSTTPLTSSSSHEGKSHVQPNKPNF
jgi:hypothetical protein